MSWEERGVNVEKGAGRNRVRWKALRREGCGRCAGENGMREVACLIAVEVFPVSRRGRVRIDGFIVVVRWVVWR